ncbi:MAG: PfkB family carbohydrate kinase [Planctomycetota bacterium]
MWSRLHDLIDACGGCHVAVVGDFMIDRYLYGDAERISPEAPVPVLRVVRQEDALGGAGSVAADIAALDAIPHCVGVVGPGTDAALMIDLLRKAGADPDGLVSVNDRPTTRKTRLIGLAQHRHRQQLIRVDDESTELVTGPPLDAILDHVESLAATCGVICIEDYNKGVVSAALAQRIVDIARRRDIPVLVDPAGLTEYTRYDGATIVTPNRTETEKLTGLRLRNIDAVREAAPAILEACHTKYVCVTLDADGAALIGPGAKFEHIQTKARDVYDVTGAGDEVLAALAVAVAAGATMFEAVALANVAGGLEVEKFGCVPIRRDEIIAEILLENHRALGKVRTLEGLLPELSRRRQRETVAFTNGCFDLLHAGHVASFAFCKEHADILIVGLNSDDSVRRQAKGTSRPVVPQDDRAVVLAALANVDYVVLFEEDTPRALIEAIVPDVLIKGRDWEGKTVVGKDIVERNGGKVLLAPLLEGRGTTDMIQRIRAVSE